MNYYQIAKALTDSKGRVNGQILKSRPDLVRKIEFRYKDSESIRETIYRILHHIDTRPRCLNCGGRVAFLGRSKVPFNMYCSRECGRCELTVEKVRKTNDIRYGGTGFASPILSVKSEKTAVDRHGEDYRKTLLQPRARMTKKKRYGDPNYNNRPKAVAHTDFKKIAQKSKVTCLERYSVDSYMKTDECKARINRPESILKAQETRKKNGTIRRSKIEIELADFIRETFNTAVEENRRKYLDGREIDIYLPELKIGIEVNGDFFHKNPRFYKDPDEPANLPGNDKLMTVGDVWSRDREKKRIAESKGIELIAIWEYDIRHDFDSVKKRIYSLFK